MRAELKPLEGQYYGTRVKVFDDDNASTGVIVIWLNPSREEDYKPSERELAAFENHKQHELERYEWEDEEEKKKFLDEEFEICDNHYESQLAFRTAQILVTAINREPHKV